MDIASTLGDKISNTEESPMVDTAQDLVSLRCSKFRDGSFQYQQRRHEDWREIYTLYRDKVITNRLTQRQSVNVPLMKESIRTLLAKTDEFPDLYYESLSGDKQKEIFINEYWQWWYKQDKLEIKDIVDKKQVGLYGRSVMKLNLTDGRPTIEVLEPYDWLCDRFADPSDIDETSNYQAHINIFASLSSLEANKLYDQKVVSAMKLAYAESMNLQKAEENIEAIRAKNERLQDMGQWDIENPEVGETYVELTEHHIKLWDDKAKRLRIKIRVTSGEFTLLDKYLEDLFGINFFPFITWADDIEKTDIWSDGMGDVVKTPNKVLNAWFSQLVENRTLRNFGMHFYDATASEKWIPQTYDPVPFGWYPTAGDPNKTTKQVDIPDLSESLDEMQFLIQMAERATASTATEKGTPQKGDMTLGEIKLMMASSNERLTSFAKFYRIARRELGEKWYKFLMANEKWIKPVDLYKKSSQGNYFKETVQPSDWKDEAGYVCRVTSTAERDQKNVEEVQKMQAVSNMFQSNIPLKKILQKKSLDLLNLSPEEIQEVMAFDEQSALGGVPPTGAVPSNPQVPPVQPVA